MEGGVFKMSLEGEKKNKHQSDKKGNEFQFKRRTMGKLLKYYCISLLILSISH